MPGGMLNRLRLRLRSIVLRRRLEREMQEEMRAHIEAATSRLIARGLAATEAKRAAEREFGNVAYLQEQARDARGAQWLDALAGDLRFAFRQFGRRPLTAATMLAVLAVGMAITTLLFSFVHSYATSPPPVIARDEDLVRIRGSRDAGIYGLSTRFLTEEELRAYTQLTGHFDAVAGWAFASLVLDAGEDPARRGLSARTTFVTENYFAVLGVRPLLGPGLPQAGSDDPARATSAVINYTAWDQLYGRDPDVIGATVSLNEVPVTIVGVMPERFSGVAGLSRFQFWVPLAVHSQMLDGAVPVFRAAARLRPGIGMEAATAAVQVIAATVAESDVAARDPVGDDDARGAREASADVVPLLSTNGDPMFDRDVRLMSLAIGLLAVLVLAVTCTNVSALLTGLAAARRQEIAIRLSLGAARTRLIRQLLTESALLACAAGAGALAIVWVVLPVANATTTEIPLELRITLSATSFTFGIALTLGILFGLSPALHATRLALASVLRDSAGSLAATRARLQRGLVVAQIAFTQPLMVLLAAALLVIVGEFQPYTRSESAERVISVGMPVSFSAGEAPDWAGVARQRAAVTRAVLERVQAEAGVEAAVIDWGSWPGLGRYTVDPADRPANAALEPIGLAAHRAGPGHFDVLDMALLRGRGFTRDDVHGPDDAEVPAIIGADLARRLWAGTDPVGRRLGGGGGGGRPGRGGGGGGGACDTVVAARTLVVVGVVEDPAAETRRPGDDYRVYLAPDTMQLTTALLVRTAGTASLLVPTIRKVALDEAPGTIVNIRTLAEIEDERTRNFRLMAGSVSIAGLMALLLSAIGLYAVVAFAVGQRTREIAVRMAVGAQRHEIVGRFVGDGLKLSALGLTIGLPLGVLGLHLLLSAGDFLPVSLPNVTVIAAVGVVLVATAAAWLPARRAASVDPAITLRSE